MLDLNKVKSIILDELRAKGYSPNHADVHMAAVQIMELVKDELEKAAGESVEEAKRLSVAGAPGFKVPPGL